MPPFLLGFLSHIPDFCKRLSLHFALYVQASVARNSVRTMNGGSPVHNMTKEEIITAIAVCKDGGMLERVARTLKNEDAPEVRLLTQAEAARKLGFKPETVHRLIKCGELEAVVVRGVKRVPLAALVRFANGKEVR